MCLFACPIPTPIYSDPWRWYAEHWETTSNPEFVEWARPENYAFLAAHLLWGIAILIVATSAMMNLYLTHGAKFTALHRRCVATVMIVAAVPTFFFFWDAANRWSFPHLDVEARMAFFETCMGLAFVLPVFLISAGIWIVIGKGAGKQPVEPRPLACQKVSG